MDKILELFKGLNLEEIFNKIVAFINKLLGMEVL